MIVTCSHDGVVFKEGTFFPNVVFSLDDGIIELEEDGTGNQHQVLFELSLIPKQHIREKEENTDSEDDVEEKSRYHVFGRDVETSKPKTLLKSRYFFKCTKHKDFSLYRGEVTITFWGEAWETLDSSLKRLDFSAKFIFVIATCSRLGWGVENLRFYIENI